MIYVVFLLTAFTSALASYSYFLTNRQVRPDARLYFQLRPEDRRPFAPSRSLSPVAAWVRKSFHEVYYDRQGRPSVAYRWEKGKRVETVYWTWGWEGKLVRKVTKDVEGGTRIKIYDR